MYKKYLYELWGGYFIVAQKFKKISNPLTIIGIFAGLSEISMTTALSLIDKSLQSTFIWFIIGFPFLLVVLFFLTLNFNAKILYAPSDFKDEKLFLETMKSIKIEPKTFDKTDEAKMEHIRNMTYTNQTIDLDCKYFHHCDFINCTFRYSAEGNFGLSNCNFGNTEWVLNKNAARTLTFLSDLYFKFGEIGKKTIEVTFDNIKNGVYNTKETKDYQYK